MLLFSDDCGNVWAGGISLGNSLYNSNWRWKTDKGLKPITYFNWATEWPEPNNYGGTQDRMYLFRKYDYKWGDMRHGVDYYCLLCEYSLD